MTDIPEQFTREGSKLCCVEGNIYLVGGGGNEGREVTEYNPCTHTWREMPRLQLERFKHYNVCTIDDKIFVIGGDNTCEMLDLSDDDPQWKLIANMNNQHHFCGIATCDRKIYVLGGHGTDIEVYDVDQGISFFDEILLLTLDLYRSLELC